MENGVRRMNRDNELQQLNWDSGILREIKIARTNGQITKDDKK